MESNLTPIIKEAAIEVHKQLGGPGLLEGIYESALCHELLLRGLKSQRQLPIPVTYKNVNVREPLFLDILVENTLIIEVKATGRDYPFYHAQLNTYLRLTGVSWGMIINFGKKDVVEGISLLRHQSQQTLL
ncbi:MAG TPA: GxxExxY protein [Rhabdochlamydiaceae bacterium]|jgi:GxxExxY protein|nr:GxxExxY protein [Rhabdochlamydiaceae bacterium]